MKKEVIEKVSALLIAAFGLVAALAWNDAIKALFVEIFGSAGTIIAMFLYAIVVTIIAVWVTIRMAHFSQKAIILSERSVATVKNVPKKVIKK